jgi:hypothetical protein
LIPGGLPNGSPWLGDRHRETSAGIEPPPIVCEQEVSPSGRDNGDPQLALCVGEAVVSHQARSLDGGVPLSAMS